jgi:hypothetical protein
MSITGPKIFSEDANICRNCGKLPTFIRTSSRQHMPHRVQKFYALTSAQDGGEYDSCYGSFVPG